MNTTDNTTEIGGHRCQNTGMKEGIGGMTVTLWHCIDCGLVANWNSFDSGLRGCPKRPASLDYLSVCAGGENCEGHPDNTSPQWEAYRRSNHLSIDTVPRYTHSAGDLGLRAAKQWLDHADRIGLKMSVWAQEAIANRVGAEGGRIAELTHQGRPYHVIVTRTGQLAAHPGRDYDCQACTTLREKGSMQ